MTNLSHILQLHPNDNIAIAKIHLAPQSIVSEQTVTLEEIPAAHKVALENIFQGDAILRYGQIIGFATQDIKAGEHVHVHNLAMADFDRDYAFGENVIPVITAPQSRTFLGIKRADGRVATRNYVGVISTVNCSATVVKKVAQYFDRPEMMDKYPNVDGVVALSHSFGCCIDHHGEGLKQLRRTIAGYMEHPNFAAVIIVGLGCEANQLKPLLQSKNAEYASKIQSLVMQEEGGTQKTIDKAIARKVRYFGDYFFKIKNSSK